MTAPGGGRKQPFFGVCAIVKNEGGYIYEWLTYHFHLGCRAFFLYDNNSTDNMVSEIYRWQQRAGLDEEHLRIIDWPYIDGPPQVLAYRDALINFAPQVEWLAFIDADEFICPQDNENLADILRSLPAEFGGLYVHWYFFGSSGFVERQDGLVTETFVTRGGDDFYANHCGKTIIRTASAAGPWPGIHVIPSRLPIVDDSGRPIDQTSLGHLETRSHQRISLNHYFTKSRAEWIVRRRGGRADKNADDPEFRRPDHDFAICDVNDVVDLRARNLMQAARRGFY